MPPAPDTDEALASAARDGCRDSFNELARRLRARLVFALTRRLGSEHDAEDVAQQTLMRVHERLGDYNPKRPLGPWVMTIAFRLAIDLQRGAARRDPARLVAAGVLEADLGDTPAQAAERREQRDELWATAERALHPEQWTALWLHYGEGMTPKEVASALGQRGGAVRVMLHRARKTLGEALSASNATTGDTTTSAPTNPVPATTGAAS